MAFDDKLKSLAELIKPTTDVAATSWLLYGAAGTGKTSLAVSASKEPSMGKVLVLDFENGSRYPAVEHGDIDNLTIVSIPDYPTAASVLKEVQTAVGQGDFPYGTIVLDTLDKFQEYVVSYWEAKNPSDGFAKWAASYSRVIEIIDALQHQLNVNVIALTHEEREIDPVNGGTFIAPAFEGKKSLKKVPSNFDFVGRMVRVEVSEGTIVPVLTTDAEGDIVVKRRIKGFPGKLGAPTFTKIVTHLNKALKEAS